MYVSATTACFSDLPIQDALSKLVDLEFTLRNLASVEQRGGAFHKAMIERANRARAKIDAILAAAPIPELADALKAVPADLDESTEISADLAASLSAAGRLFVKEYDGSTLGPIDSQIPTEVKGSAYKE